MADKIIEVRGLTGGYGRSSVVEDVDMWVGRGEIVALVGPNGSGKSTLLKSIYGVARVFSGSVIFEGVDVTRTPPERKTAMGMNFVPQTENVFPDLTVRENLEMGGYLLGSEDEVKEGIETVLSIFPRLKRHLDTPAGSLSGGEQRMVAVGRALMTRPRMLLMDEPTAGLAPRVAMELLDSLESIRREAGVSILIVEQHARRALELSDRGYVLVSGRIVAEGGGEDILSRRDLQQLFLGLR